MTDPEKWLNALKLTTREVLIGLVACVILLLADTYAPALLGTQGQSFIATYRIIIVIILVLCVSALLVQGLLSVGVTARARWKEKNLPSEGREKLSHLTESEKLLLLTLLQGAPLRYGPSDSIEELGGLRAAGIIYPKQTYELNFGYAEYHLFPWALEYLRKHESSLYPDTKS
jgi:hypothetical protein